MTIDEAIKHEEEVAEENQRIVDTGIVYGDVTIDMLYCDDTEVIEEHLANYQKCADEHRQLAELLKELKQLREQTRWIPCSERLPEDGEVVLGTNSNNDWFKTYTWDDCGEIKWYACGCFDVPVIAWMPLPGPYEGDKKDD